MQLFGAADFVKKFEKGERNTTVSLMKRDVRVYTILF